MESDSDSPNFQAFLAESLELWGVEGRIEPGTAPVVALVHAADGTVIPVARVTDPELPFRWTVRGRPCGSLVGVLAALRAALGVDRGAPLRIAPAPEA